jgi:hypothetical protein
VFFIESPFITNCFYFDDRLAKEATSFANDSRTVQTFGCMNMSVCIGSGGFLCKVCMYLKKKFITLDSINVSV